ncbi:MAG: hypothetical protein RJB37_4060, partial [Pseudomonadota bacterium]
MRTLPIDASRDALAAALSTPGERPVVVVAPTGSGKSTRLPLWLDAWGHGPVLVIEPRRVACRALAGFLREAVPEARAQYDANVSFALNYRARCGAGLTASATRRSMSPSQNGRVSSRPRARVPAGSSHQFVFATSLGCDSILTVQVTALPGAQSAASSSICAGDSVLIFGQWRKQTGAFSQVFAAQNGC